MSEKRDVSMHFWATQEEYDLIQKNMALSGSTNLSAFLRKMAIDGMVIRLDMPEIQEMLHLLGRANANIDQITRHLHDTGRIYDTDLEEILGFQKETAVRLNDILTKLSALK
ncbi:MAG: plasmid mobilization protein [Candidatus Flemingiibacterium sp.]